MHVLRQDNVPLQMTQLVCKLKLVRVLCQALQKERMIDVAHLYLSYIDIASNVFIYLRR